MEEKRGLKFVVVSKVLLMLTLSFLVSVFFNIGNAKAATLYFVPRVGEYTVGKSFSVSVNVSTQESANAFQATVNFPQDKLQLVSLSKSGSIISLWVQEPSFSSANGTARFEGVVPNPGYTGSNGKIITLNFKIKSAGEAHLSFSDGSVLANDGQGTNILSSAGAADFIFNDTGQAQAPEPTGGAAGPASPKVWSSTHLDASKWYADSNPKFEWTLPGGVTAISYLVTASSVSNPGTVADPLASSRAYSNIEDGAKYFHIRFKNSAGWGNIAHFKFQIDTVAPSRPKISFLPALPDDPKTKVYFEAKDDLSGLAYYEVIIDNSAPAKVDREAISSSNPYILQSNEPGKHLLLVKAYDNAGNYSEATAEFTVTTLEPPKIDKIKDFNEQELLHISGETYPNSFVEIFLKDTINNTIAKQSTKSNGFGFFNLVWPDSLSKGDYEISGTVTNEQGDKSKPSDPIKFKVKAAWLSLLISYIVNFLSPLFILLLVLFAIAFLVLHLWHKFHDFRRKLRQTIKGAEDDVHKAFDGLRESVRKRILFLEKVKTKRELTIEEEKIMKQMRSDLDSVEKTIRKQIQRIEDKL
ncbi:MAG: Uncharacterized protein G01um101413_500 [Parcubacteria group bacterium Gr01-1014_13]|nr:MAG: Uncharacterized protein G01um101413_500 [Parcubacteria group bacterium Gr01-1014_13]